jgi:hypothetical protein
MLTIGTVSVATTTGLVGGRCSSLAPFNQFGADAVRLGKSTPTRVPEVRNVGSGHGLSARQHDRVAARPEVSGALPSRGERRAQRLCQAKASAGGWWRRGRLRREGPRAPANNT